MLDVVTEGLIAKGNDSIAFDSDCLLSQGQVERYARVVRMVGRHDAEGFGSCSNEGECEAVCLKEISVTNIARMNREYVRATLLRGR